MLQIRPLDNPNGLALSPARDGSAVKAAYYSAAFLLLHAATDELDVAAEEMEISSLYWEQLPGQGSDAETLGVVFLNDRLPNGAGFTRYRGGLVVLGCWDTQPDDLAETTLPVAEFVAALGGAILFAASDSLIAIRRFVEPLPWADPPIMLLYWAGQCGIAFAGMRLAASASGVGAAER